MNETVAAWAQRQGYPYVRQLTDGRLVGVQAMTYGKGRLWVGDMDEIMDGW